MLRANGASAVEGIDGRSRAGRGCPARGEGWCSFRHILFAAGLRSGRYDWRYDRYDLAISRIEWHSVFRTWDNDDDRPQRIVSFRPGRRAERLRFGGTGAESSEIDGEPEDFAARGTG